MWNPTEAAPAAGQPTGLLGDIQALAGQLDLPPRPLVAGAGEGGGRALSREDLQGRLDRYVAETLCQSEWPVIVEAHRLASTGKIRELIELDRNWKADAQLGPFAEASFRAGRRQLNRLQGLRGERLIERYRAAINAGEAWGWHPIVFGLVLAVYQLPLRQGLLQFATHSLAGLASAAEGVRGLPPSQCQNALDHAVASLPACLSRLPFGGLSTVA